MLGFDCLNYYIHYFPKCLKSSFLGGRMRVHIYNLERDLIDPLDSLSYILYVDSRYLLVYPDRIVDVTLGSSWTDKAAQNGKGWLLRCQPCLRTCSASIHYWVRDHSRGILLLGTRVATQIRFVIHLYIQIPNTEGTDATIKLFQSWSASAYALVYSFLVIGIECWICRTLS